MTAPNQTITKYIELYDLLCEKMLEDTRQNNVDAKRKIDSGASADDMQAFYVAQRKKWAFMDKMISGMSTQKVSKATLAAVREILGDELDQYL